MTETIWRGNSLLCLTSLGSQTILKGSQGRSLEKELRTGDEGCFVLAGSSWLAQRKASSQGRITHGGLGLSTSIKIPHTLVSKGHCYSFILFYFYKAVLFSVSLLTQLFPYLAFTQITETPSCYFNKLHSTILSSINAIINSLS